MSKFKKIISIIISILMIIIAVPAGNAKADEYVEPKYSLTLTRINSYYNEYRVFLFNFLGDADAKYYYRIDSNMSDITDLHEIKRNTGLAHGELEETSSKNYSLEYDPQAAVIGDLYLHVIGCSDDETEIGNAYTFPFNYASIDTINVEGNKAKVTCKLKTDYWGNYNPVNNFYLYTSNQEYINKLKEKESLNTEYIASTGNKNRIQDPIKVLNIHPNTSEIGTDNTMHYSSELKQWMEDWGKFYSIDENGNLTRQYGVGRGCIKVTSMTIDDFNLKTPTSSNSMAEAMQNISTITSLENSLKTFDVIVFGTWDCNGSKDINEKGAEIIRNFIQGTGAFSGRGKGAVIFGHDTFWSPMPNLCSLKKYVGVGIGENDVDGGNDFDTSYPYYYYNGYDGVLSDLAHAPSNIIGSGKAIFGIPKLNNVNHSVVQITKNSIFTKYPWVIGDVGSNMSIPIDHLSGQYVDSDKSDTFLKFYNLEYSNYDNNITSKRRKWSDYNFYLAVNKEYKTAMIQTGHSNCQSTFDERKIWANLIFYLAQKEVDNKLEINLYDSKAPKKPSFTGNPTSDDNNKKVTFNLNDGEDIDEDFYFYIKTNNSISNDVETSLYKHIEYQSGFDYFEYYIDETETANKNITSTTSTTSTTINYNYTDSDCGKTKYIHVRATDKEGNKSDFVTKSFTIKSNEGTVIVKYVDTNGTEIATSSTITGKIGDAYTTSSKSISGYTLISTPSNATGTIKEDIITVIYRYSKDEESSGGLTLSKNPNLIWTNGNVTITARASFSGSKIIGYDEETDTYDYEYNYVKSITGLGSTTNFTPNSYTRTTTRTATSNNTYSFSATGKLSSASASIKVVEIDKDKPTISGYPSENWTKDDVNLNIKLTDSTSGVLNAKLTGNILPVSTKSWSSTTPGSTVSTKTEYYTEKIGTEGRHSYNIEVTDNATNSESGSFKLNIDKTAPEITGTVGDKFNNKDIDLEDGGDYSIISEDIPIKVNALDELSGVKEFKLYETDENFSNEKEIKNSTISSKDSYPEKENGDIEYHLKANSDYEGYGYHYYVAKAKDEVGNESEIKFKIYFRPEVELLGLINTYRVPFINQKIVERVPGPVSTPLKIVSGVKIGMEVDFKGADIAEVEFYKNGNTKINGIKFESSDSTLVTYNKTLATKYVASDWTNGDNSSDNKVSMLISNPDQRNKTNFSFVLPNKGSNACKHGDVISMKVILYSKEKNKINIELGNKFFYIQDDVEQQLTINNIR